MPDLEHARMLLRLARRDERAMSAMVDPVVFDTAIIGFHAQQAVEKALKGWLSLADVLYPPTHSLHVLVELLEGAGQSDATRFRHLVSLTPFAIQMRYDESADDFEFDRPALLREVGALLDDLETRICAVGGAASR
jgi:HEPN domain-containing protein